MCASSLKMEIQHILWEKLVVKWFDWLYRKYVIKKFFMMM